MKKYKPPALFVFLEKYQTHAAILALIISIISILWQSAK